ncbi:hypothetical protein TWF730_008343 [Orbilia blumenaviensis]|uniref:FAD-binding FR-type domain-containing protein n=1 Tax=Orbilia blumenaviensis TaxID=1796055 RepID=A0AAV9V5X6_9PEZI
MSPRYPYPTRLSDLDLSDILASPANSDGSPANNSETLKMWWPSSHFNLRPALSERVSEFVKRSAASTVAAAAEGRGGGEQNAIIDALEFTRWLGVYYNIACVLFPIGVFVIRKAAGRIKGYKKAQRKKNKEESSDSDSRSFKNGNVDVSVVETASTASGSSASSAIIPAEIDSDESKPLLHNSSSSSKLPWYTLLYRRIKGFLTYQRPNDARGRVIPHNSILIINQLFFWTSIFLSIYKIYYPLDMANDNSQLRFFLLADRWGMIFTMNQPLNFILAAKTSPIKYLTGWSYEEHLIVHRMVATTSHVASLIHFAGMYVVYRMFIARTGQSFMSVLSRPDILFGVVSFVAFWIFGFTSVDEFRAKSYEIFLATHISFATLAMIFLYLHHPAARIYVVWSFAIWGIDRLVYRAYNKRWSADGVVQVLDESTLKVTIKNFGGSKKMKWEPAGHVFLTVPGWTRLQAHPFTIFTAPVGYDLEGNNIDDANEKEMVLVIRRLKGFTDALYGMGDEQGRIKVVVDGPYGSEHARGSLKDCQKTLFIAGGSGIAVAWPLMCEIIRREMDKNKNGKGGKRRKIVLVWIVHHEHHLNWIEQDLEKLEEVKRTMPREFEIEVRKFVTRGVNGRRPDLRKEVTRVVEDEDGVKVHGRTGVLVCGPDAMMREVRTIGRDLLWEGKDVEILAEKFGW